MANTVFNEQENAFLHTPSLSMRKRLQSAPEKLMKTPVTTKKFQTPLLSGRKALGTVNKCVSVRAQERQEPKTRDGKVKSVPQKVEECPEIETFIPCDPLEFEKYSIPSDLIPVSDFALPGLACFPPMYISEEDKNEAYTEISPIKMQKCSDYSEELDDFLQTIDELIDFPPEPDSD